MSDSWSQAAEQRLQQLEDGDSYSFVLLLHNRHVTQVMVFLFEL